VPFQHISECSVQFTPQVLGKPCVVQVGTEYVCIADKWYRFYTASKISLSLLSVRSTTTYGTYFRLCSRYAFLLPYFSNSPATLSQKSNRQGSYGSGVNRAYPLWFSEGNGARRVMAGRFGSNISLFLSFRDYVQRVWGVVGRPHNAFLKSILRLVHAGPPFNALIFAYLILC